MSRVRTFSRVFPAYHPRAGEPTHFAEQVLNSLGIDYCGVEYREQLMELNNVGCDKSSLCEAFWEDLEEMSSAKGHTIRAGNTFKVGDRFSPSIWTGKPYHSKQLKIAPDIEVKKLWNIDMVLTKILAHHRMKIQINAVDWVTVGVSPHGRTVLLAARDGLTEPDFINWFNKLPFKGQIICWDNNITYI